MNTRKRPSLEELLRLYPQLRAAVPVSEQQDSIVAPPAEPTTSHSQRYMEAN